MIKKILLIISLFVTAMVGGIFATQYIWPNFVEKPLAKKYNLEAGPIYLTEIKEIYIQENTALIDAIERVEKAIVALRTRTSAGQTLYGSGLIITSDGLLVTLAELVPQGAEFIFYIEHKPLPFQVLKRDLENNLALIKVSDSFFHTTGFSRSEDLEIGQRVFLLGKMFINNDIYKSVNEGIIKSVDDKFIYTNILEEVELSGSPLFNIHGEVLGLVFIEKNGKVNAIPISIIREFIGL